MWRLFDAIVWSRLVVRDLGQRRFIQVAAPTIGSFLEILPHFEARVRATGAGATTAGRGVAVGAAVGRAVAVSWVVGADVGCAVTVVVAVGCGWLVAVLGEADVAVEVGQARVGAAVGEAGASATAEVVVSSTAWAPASAISPQPPTVKPMDNAARAVFTAATRWPGFLDRAASLRSAISHLS